VRVPVQVESWQTDYDREGGNVDVGTDWVKMLVNSSGYRLKASEIGYCFAFEFVVSMESNNGRIVLAHWVMKNVDVGADSVEMLLNSSGYRPKALEAGYCLHFGSLLTAESNDGRIVLAHWVTENLEPHLQTGTVIADVTVDLLAVL
jgi:hypothetical protein